MLKLKSEPPLSLYIHLPWCIKKCPYCDFNSHQASADLGDLENIYIDTLIKDIEFSLPQICQRPIISIFIGGGTPSLFSISAIDRLMDALSKKLTLCEHAEITIEANPDSADVERFKGYRYAGINRISIGIQSFDNEKLSLLGRTHDRDVALHAIDMARDVGFEQINIDLMYGLPRQTIDQAISDLEIALQQGVLHLSWYQLTIEPGTAFYSKPPVLPQHELLWQMQQQGQTYLSDHGFDQYEISSYAKIGSDYDDRHQCRHNLNYWQFGDYIGIGAGSHSKLTQLATGEIRRYARHRSPHSYINYMTQKNAMTEQRVLSKNELPLEFMMNTLRLNQGFRPVLFSDRTGLQLAQISQPLELAEQRTWIKRSSENIRATAYGQQYLNDVLQLFMP